MMRLRGFIRREGARRRRRGRRETETTRGRERRERGAHPWRTPPTMTISTVPSPPDRVLLLLTTNMTPRTTSNGEGHRLSQASYRHYLSRL